MDKDKEVANLKEVVEVKMMDFIFRAILFIKVILMLEID